MEGWSISDAKVPAKPFLYSGSLIGYWSYNQGGALLEEEEEEQEEEEKEEVVTAVFSLAKRYGLHR